MAEDWETAYPWDTWLDGTERVFRQGAEYGCSRHLAIWTAKNAARRRGASLEVTDIDDRSFRARVVYDQP
ncbi:MAG TPA: hypothetical protein VII33_13340 [Nakamurella sp.]